MEATNNFVIIKKDEDSSQSTGGILLPSSAKIKPHVGTVLSVGPLVGDKKIKNGKRVIFHSTVGFNIEYESNDYWILMGNEIIATV